MKHRRERNPHMLTKPSNPSTPREVFFMMAFYSGTENLRPRKCPTCKYVRRPIYVHSLLHRDGHRLDIYQCAGCGAWTTRDHRVDYVETVATDFQLDVKETRP
jgi:hypothetical protein